MRSPFPLVAWYTGGGLLHFQASGVGITSEINVDEDGDNVGFFADLLFETLPRWLTLRVSVSIINTPLGDLPEPTSTIPFRRANGIATHISVVGP